MFRKCGWIWALDSSGHKDTFKEVCIDVVSFDQITILETHFIRDGFWSEGQQHSFIHDRLFLIDVKFVLVLVSRTKKGVRDLKKVECKIRGDREIEPQRERETHTERNKH